MNYKPLPDGLYIGMSSIEGQGVYTSRALFKGCQLGESHYRVATNDVPSKHTEENKSILIRTPFGGFINHSDKPNCHRSQIRVKPGLDKWIITVVEDVSPGDELTLKYTMYDPRK
tara:strand:+ start:79 stop:423 length:345 start_codon:yes stop_codon:yes gene_type:complete